jgi:pimeloyl-ACP methyl ester carboxylesterase
MTTMRPCAVETAFGTIAGLRAGEAGAPRVLALHGWLDNAASFQPLSQHLRGIDLVAIDLPGHGASAHLPLPADYLLITFARAAFAAADALGWERFALLGHSLGGVVASVMASAQPQRIERLLAIEALGALAEKEERTARRLRDAFDAHRKLTHKQLRVFPDAASAARARLQAGTGDLGEAAALLLVERGLRKVDGGFAWRSDPRLTMPTAVRMSEAQSRDLIANIECPTRVIYADPPQNYFPDALRRERAALLRNGELVVLSGSHHLHMDDAAGTAAAIGDFFIA